MCSEISIFSLFLQYVLFNGKALLRSYRSINQNTYLFRFIWLSNEYRIIQNQRVIHPCIFRFEGTVCTVKPNLTNTPKLRSLHYYDHKFLVQTVFQKYFKGCLFRIYNHPAISLMRPVIKDKTFFIMYYIVNTITVAQSTLSQIESECYIYI